MAVDELRLRAKIDQIAPDPELRTLNRQLVAGARAWLAGFEAVAVEVAQRVAPGERFILVDDDQLRTAIGDPRAVPFLERDGEYWGPPPDDATAIHELERLQRAGASLVVFSWSAFWWLDHYAELRRYLNARGSLVLASEWVVIYELSAHGKRRHGRVAASAAE